MIGRTLEHYRIESKLGEGGMGVVYKGHDARLDRPVAIKILQPEQLSDDIVKQRFAREARSASSLNHPGIVTIHDIRSADGLDFIVMEYIEGSTLDALIPPRGMPAAQVLRYAIQMADALAAAHGAGIVHRDLKPSNVMVTPAGRVKIMDFGLAKQVETTAPSPGSTTFHAQLTEAQVVVGTAAYMSPEQAEGRKLDARSDIFTFGAVLYEMATGQRPFAGESWLALLARILNEEPKPPGVIASSIPPDLEKIILRALRKDPGRRYQTMADLRVALEDLEVDVTSGRKERPSARVAWRRWGGAAALLPIAMAVAYAGWRAWTVEPTAPVQASTLTTFPGQELYPSLSPDGGHVVFTWTGPRQDNTDIYVQQIGAGSPLRLTTDPQPEFNPVWSPDGRWIAFLRGNTATPLGSSDRQVRLIAPLGGPERHLADIRVREITVNPAYLTWCPDSTCLIASDTTGEGRPDALFTIAVETGEKRQLTDPSSPALADTNPAVSPDGSSLLFLRRATWAFGELHVLRLRVDMTPAGAVRPVRVARLKPDTATWLPDGDGILVSALAGGAALWRVSSAGRGEPRRVPFVGEDGVMPATSRAQPGRPGRLVYVRSFTDENTWRIDTSAAGAQTESAAVVAIASTKADIHPQFSPDGRRVAFTSTRSGAWEIWTSEPDGSNAAQLTFLDAPTGTGAPTWSPDGRLIAFASDAEGQFDIFVVPSAGGKPRNVTSHPAIEHVPAFSSDGRWIYFSSSRSDGFQVWKVPVSGGEAEQVTTAGGWLSREGAGGTELYFTASPAIGASTELWRMSVSGGRAVKVVDRILNHTFDVLESGVYYIDQSPTEAQLLFYDFGRRSSAVVARNLGVGLAGLTASRDGRTVLFARQDSAVDDLMMVDNFR
ncbi:MAG: protein kinase domain-containing protein [Acidobacteriota bacterium]